jgi:hypothetical protein
MLGLSGANPVCLLHRLSFFMTSQLRLWVVVFNRDGLDFGSGFRVDTTNDANVYKLKTKVKDMIGNHLSHILASELTIWRCKDRTTVFVDDSDESGDTRVLFRQIRKVFSPEEKVEVLSASKRLAALNISEKETLLVEIPLSPGTPRISTAFGYALIRAIVKACSVGLENYKVLHEFESVYLQVRTKEGVTERDNYWNDIDEPLRDVPGFVKEHENILGQKRKVSDKVGQIYILSTCHADDEIRRVQLLNIGLAKQLQRNTLIIQ